MHNQWPKPLQSLLKWSTIFLSYSIIFLHLFFALAPLSILKCLWYCGKQTEVEVVWHLEKKDQRVPIFARSIHQVYNAKKNQNSIHSSNLSVDQANSSPGFNRRCSEVHTEISLKPMGQAASCKVSKFSLCIRSFCLLWPKSLPRI